MKGKELRIKCPYCGHEINGSKLARLNLKTRTAYYVCTCWSGDIHRKAPRHHFIAKVKNIRVFTIDNNDLEGAYKRKDGED